MDLGIDTVITVLAAGLIFVLALVLGVWKYQQMAVMVGEIGGFAVLLSGSVAVQLF